MSPRFVYLQVLASIRHGEETLRSKPMILNNLPNAQKSNEAHEVLITATEKTRSSVMQVQADARQLHESDFMEPAREVAETVRHAWQALARHHDDRTKLTAAAIKFYQTVEQVGWLQADL